MQYDEILEWLELVFGGDMTEDEIRDIVRVQLKLPGGSRGNIWSGDE